MRNSDIGLPAAALPPMTSETALLKAGERKALKTFQRAAETIPAYKKFLKEHGVRAASVKTISDFAKLPETDKKNYIRKYSAEERSPGGTFAAHRIIAASSGTTGAPTLWPRGSEQEAEAAAVHEFLFRELYEVDRYKTLLIIGFPMGIYVSGMATTLPSYLASLKHPNLTLLTAGNNKESVLGALPSLQGQFEQIIFAGHPFFVKDLIESGARAGIRWSKNKIRTFFVSEGFSEEWREYVASRLHKADSARDLFSHYGSSELLLMGYESPETILIRKAAAKDKGLRTRLFGGSLPSLFHYHPALRHIESNASGELLFTAWSGIPLIRYNMRDAGKVMSRSYVEEALKGSGVSLAKELAKRHWKPWHLPFVALEGRSDHTLVFYAANLYPEHLRTALEWKPVLSKITGKFSMEKSYARDMDQELKVHIELQENVRPSKKLSDDLTRHLTLSLEQTNMEYRFLRENLDKNLVPKVLLHSYRDEKYFKPGLKPRYIIPS